MFVNWMEKLKNSIPGRVAAVVIYALMILAVLSFFTGNGEFIYEGF